MSYAANLGRDGIIAMLRELGAADVQFAFDRACLQGRLETARQLYAMGARPGARRGDGPAETQSAGGARLAARARGADRATSTGNRLAPVAMVLETYWRNPEGKHECLELFARHGVELPDTPPMAVHRGRIDLLEAHLRRDPELLDPHLRARGDLSARARLPRRRVARRCTARRSPAGRCCTCAWTTTSSRSPAGCSTHGADADARAAVDADGFGGHTPLFGCVVSQPYRNGRAADNAFARLLLDRGADPNVRASLRKGLRGADDETLHEYRDVTPLAWGRFHDQDFVNPAVLALLAERGARE